MLARLKFDITDLVNEILNQIPNDVIINGKVFDPAMGGGQFVKEIERRKRLAGKTDREISETVFGYEENILRRDYAVNKYNLKGKYIVDNFLERDFKDMKFDVIIGNPPYQSNEDRQSKGNKVKSYKQPLWPLFIQKSLNLLNKNGYLGMVTPIGWLAGTYDIRQGKIHLIDYFTNEFNLISVRTDSNKIREDFFPGIGSSFGYFILNNSNYNEKTLLKNEYGTFKDYNFKKYKILPPDPHPIKISIAKKTLFADNKKFNFKSVQFNQSNLNQDIKNPSETHKYKGYANGGQGGKHIVFTYWKDQDQYYGQRKIVLGKQDRSYIPFIDDEGLNIGNNQMWFMNLENDDNSKFSEKVFYSKLFKFLMLKMRHGAGPETWIVKNLPKLDLTKDWNDQEIFQYFKLDKKEIDYINENIK